MSGFIIENNDEQLVEDIVNNYSEIEINESNIVYTRSVIELERFLNIQSNNN